MAIHVTSSAFSPGETIPDPYTCVGVNISPPLAWSGAPASTVSYALICEDPDAPRGIWCHWLVWNIPAGTMNISENFGETVTAPIRQGVNDSHTHGYAGPCPPHGSTHRYYYRLYALDATLTLADTATRAQLLHAMEGHILDEGELMGRFGR